MSCDTGMKMYLWEVSCDEDRGVLGNLRKRRLRAKGDGDSQVEFIRAHLKSLSPEEILSFDELLDSLRFRAYRRELWGAAYLMNGGCSDDGFEYFRAWLISRGRTTYEQALADPDSLSVECTSSHDYELEALLYVADEAYEQRSGSDMPDRERRFPDLEGPEWAEDDLEVRYPRIWAKLNKA